MAEEKNKQKSAEGGSATGGKEKAAAPAPQAEKPAPKPHASKENRPHGKKIGKMNLAEIEMAIERCQKQMGGLWSHYGQSLIGRKAALTPPAPVRLKKAT